MSESSVISAGAKREGRTPTPLLALEPESSYSRSRDSRRSTNADETHGSTCQEAPSDARRSRVSKDASKGTFSPSERRLLYFVWRKMVLRCTDSADPAFARYGARGITVCAQWSTWPGFIQSIPAGYANGLQLDRLDNDGVYSLENCRWSTRRENQANTRKTRLVSAFGETLPLREWSRRTGIHHSVIARRIDRGEAPERALADHGGTMAAKSTATPTRTGCLDYGDGTFGWARIGGAA